MFATPRQNIQSFCHKSEHNLTKGHDVHGFDVMSQSRSYQTLDLKFDLIGALIYDLAGP